MVEAVQPVASELILGGQRSGKSRRAEMLARDWLAADAGRSAVLIATAEAGDDEMHARILRHREDRALRVPRLCTVEEPLRLAQTIRRHAGAHTLVVVDCLTLWLGNLMMPLRHEYDGATGPGVASSADLAREQAMLLDAISATPGPLVLVGNEIGLGVVPMGAQVRSFVDALGRLNQDVAQACRRVTLMVAGLPLTLKESR